MPSEGVAVFPLVYPESLAMIDVLVALRVPLQPVRNGHVFERTVFEQRPVHPTRVGVDSNPEEHHLHRAGFH